MKARQEQAFSLRKSGKSWIEIGHLIGASAGDALTLARKRAQEIERRAVYPELAGLPTRARNALIHGGITTRDAARRCTLCELSRLSHLGIKSVADVLAWLGISESIERLAAEGQPLGAVTNTTTVDVPRRGADADG